MIPLQTVVVSIAKLTHSTWSLAQPNTHTNFDTKVNAKLFLQSRYVHDIKHVKGILFLQSHFWSTDLKL